MAKYRHQLPQLGTDLFMTDGGLETSLIYLEGQELPHFAAFHLLATPNGVDSLRRYFRSYGELATKYEVGLLLETATWRCSPEWGAKLGYGAEDLASLNRMSVRMLEDLRQEVETPRTPVVISGCVGPRGDGYVPEGVMSEAEAERYHLPQVATFADTAADLVSGITMNYTEEAVGIARAARQLDMPVVLSFTVETDGRLPTGQPLREAIEQVDDATDGYPAYFMINCAHPSHFRHVVRGEQPWTRRIRGLRANASRASHAELNEAVELDAGDPVELGVDYAALRRHDLKDVNVMGGCCGTDHRHVEQIVAACLPAFRPLG
jgi:S-methylmethionine-dependent homocysteine/selenocysteine methylase